MGSHDVIQKWLRLDGKYVEKSTLDEKWTKTKRCAHNKEQKKPCQILYEKILKYVT